MLNTMDKKRRYELVIPILIISMLLNTMTLSFYISKQEPQQVDTGITVSNYGEELILPTPKPEEVKATPIPTAAPTPKPTEAPTTSDVDLIALVTMAEAEGECEEGKRLVIDTILNRMDSPSFPNTANGVIYQKNQFEAMWNGRVNRCSVRDDIRQLVIEEMASRTNSEVLYFRTGHYSSYGTPLFQVGNHYFSK